MNDFPFVWRSKSYLRERVGQRCRKATTYPNPMVNFDVQWIFEDGTTIVAGIGCAKKEPRHEPGAAYAADELRISE